MKDSNLAVDVLLGGREVFREVDGKQVCQAKILAGIGTPEKFLCDLNRICPD